MVWFCTTLVEAAHLGGEGKHCIKSHEEGNGKPPHFIFPRHDMDSELKPKLTNLVHWSGD